MENYNETSGNGNRKNENVDQQWINRNQSNQENQSHSNRRSSQQEGQNKRPIYIKDMPEIKPETNQGGI